MCFEHSVDTSYGTGIYTHVSAHSEVGYYSVALDHHYQSSGNPSITVLGRKASMLNKSNSWWEEFIQMVLVSLKIY